MWAVGIPHLRIEMWCTRHLFLTWHPHGTVLDGSRHGAFEAPVAIAVRADRACMTVTVPISRPVDLAVFIALQRVAPRFGCLCEYLLLIHARVAGPFVAIASFHCCCFCDT